MQTELVRTLWVLVAPPTANDELGVDGDVSPLPLELSADDAALEAAALDAIVHRGYVSVQHEPQRSAGRSSACATRGLTLGSHLHF